MSEDGILSDDLLRLRQLGVDSGKLVHRRSYAEARHVRRQKLLVQRVVQYIGFAPLSLPVGVAPVAIRLIAAAAVLEVIAVLRRAGLTLGWKPLMVEGGTVEPCGVPRWLIIVMIGED